MRDPNDYLIDVVQSKCDSTLIFRVNGIRISAHVWTSDRGHGARIQSSHRAGAWAIYHDRTPVSQDRMAVSEWLVTKILGQIHRFEAMVEA